MSHVEPIFFTLIDVFISVPMPSAIPFVVLRDIIVVNRLINEYFVSEIEVSRLVKIQFSREVG